LSQIVALYRWAVDGKLSALDFYGATGLDKFDLFQLQAAHPELFPRGDIPGGHAIPATNRSPEKLDDAALERLWRAEVISGKRTIVEFCRDHGIRYNRIRHLRRTTERERLTVDTSGKISKTDPD